MAQWMDRYHLYIEPLIEMLVISIMYAVTGHHYRSPCSLVLISKGCQHQLLLPLIYAMTVERNLARAVRIILEKESTNNLSKGQALCKSSNYPPLLFWPILYFAMFSHYFALSFFLSLSFLSS